MDGRRLELTGLRASEIAMMRGGAGAAVLAALAALRADGLVEAHYGRMVRSWGEIDPGRDPVERAVHAEALEEPVRVTVYRTRLMVAIELDEVQAAVAQKGRRRWAVQHHLRRLRREHAHLAPDRTSAESERLTDARDVAMAVALFGEEALVAFDPRFAAAVLSGPPQGETRQRRAAERSRLRADGTEPGSLIGWAPPAG